MLLHTVHYDPAYHHNTKWAVILFIGEKIQACHFTTKCKKLRNWTVQKHNFPHVIVLNAKALKSAGVLFGRGTVGLSHQKTLAFPTVPG